MAKQDTDEITQCDVHIACPDCQEQVNIIDTGRWGRELSIGYHNKKYWLNKTQYVEAECRLSGATIKSTKTEEEAA